MFDCPLFSKIPFLKYGFPALLSPVLVPLGQSQPAEIKWLPPVRRTSSNLKEHLENLSWQQATRQVPGFNTIATLVYHTHYYVSAVLNVLQGAPLDAKDKYSFDHPPIQSQEDRDKLLQKTWTSTCTTITYSYKTLHLFRSKKRTGPRAVQHGGYDMPDHFEGIPVDDLHIILMGMVVGAKGARARIGHADNIYGRDVGAAHDKQVVVRHKTGLARGEEFAIA
ncbi:MAG: hypothetical protein IPM81_13560 [Saprospirales bacterium]|nr:hypothetical protein [Saprospirales bacterium]